MTTNSLAKTWIAALLLLGSMLFHSQLNAAAPSLAVGSKAPKFSATTHEGKPWNLTDFADKRAVLLYFYPKDDTPGCTTEACGFRDRIGELKKSGVEVVGISFDNAESHKKFAEKYNLNFPLLVDTEGKVADLYQARMPAKNMARRISFLIDKDGKIIHITDNPSAAVHLEEMTAALPKLK
jgi:peroxiredoxin Q/BCP